MHESIQSLFDQWQLNADGAPTETFSSMLYPVRYQSHPAMLKYFKPHSDEQHSPAILRCYDGQGAVRCYAETGDTVLLERLSPAAPLSTLVTGGNDREATAIFCEVARRLHRASFNPAHFTPLSQLGDGYDRYLTSGDMTLSAQMVGDAQQTFQQLWESQQKPVLLHGDLHHDNILHDQQRGWLAIDPKGYVGEAEAEVACFLRNPTHPRYYADAAILNARITQISQTLLLDERRIRRWAYCLYVLSLIWHLEDGTLQDTFLPFLEKLRP